VKKRARAKKSKRKFVRWIDRVTISSSPLGQFPEIAMQAASTDPGRLLAVNLTERLRTFYRALAEIESKRLGRTVTIQEILGESK
jgi:hypothetical protein